MKNWIREVRIDLGWVSLPRVRLLKTNGSIAEKKSSTKNVRRKTWKTWRVFWQDAPASCAVYSWHALVDDDSRGRVQPAESWKEKEIGVNDE